MNVADIKRGIKDGSLVRTPDGRVRPVSLRESLGLSVVRCLDQRRGITSQDIIRRENLRNMARRYFKNGGCLTCVLVGKCQRVGKLTDNTRCFSPDGHGSCKNRTEKKGGAA